MEESNERQMNHERSENEEEPNDKEKDDSSIQRNECNNCNCELNGLKELDCRSETEDNPKNENLPTTTCRETASEVPETSKNEKCENRRRFERQGLCEKSKECCENPPKTKDSSNIGKTKRKSRSTRRRLNALISNSSLHFSDTDSEEELTMIRNQARNASPARFTNGGPEISVTLEEIEIVEESEPNPSCLMSPSEETGPRVRRGSFTENHTDVDEIYPSDLEVEEKKENCRNSLTVTKENACSLLAGETDVEDLSNEEAEPSTILMSPKIELLCEFNGETITTTEGDGPFSVEIRNKIISRMDSLTCDDPGAQNSPDIVIMPITDSEDMEMSDEDECEAASCSQKELFEDLEVLAASQIVMTNLNKVKSGSALSVKDVQDDGSIGDCHTDVEDVD